MLTNEQKQRLKKLVTATEEAINDEHVKEYGWSADAVKKEDALLGYIEELISAAVGSLEESVDQLTGALEDAEKELLGLKTGAGGKDSEIIKQLKEANELLKADLAAATKEVKSDAKS